MNTDIVRAAQALGCGDTTALALHLRSLFPHDRRAAKARKFVAAALSSPAAVAPIGREQPFLDNIVGLIGGRVAPPLGKWARLRQRLGVGVRGDNAPGRGACVRNRVVIGEELDFLGERRGMEVWSIAQALNFLLLRQLSPRKRCAAVVSMRNDGIYILQWLAHHLVVGVDRIFVYTNDNEDGSEILLRLLADHNIITLVENKTSGKVSPQGKSFEHAIHLLVALRDYEWVCFFDSDEYLVPAARFGYSVEQVIAAAEERWSKRPPSAICFNWLMFVSGMAYHRTPGLLLERFQHAEPNSHVKSMVRLQDVTSMRSLHMPDVVGDGFLVDSGFNPIEIVACQATPNFSGGQLNHYWGRSFEEFVVKKARGDTLKIDDFRRDFDTFFLLDGPMHDANRWPADSALIAAVKNKIAELTDLPGVREAAAAVTGEYAALIARYSAHHRLADRYEQLRPRHAK